MLLRITLESVFHPSRQPCMRTVYRKGAKGRRTEARGQKKAVGEPLWEVTWSLQHLARRPFLLRAHPTPHSMAVSILLRPSSLPSLFSSPSRSFWCTSTVSSSYQVPDALAPSSACSLEPDDPVKGLHYVRVTDLFCLLLLSVPLFLCLFLHLSHCVYVCGRGGGQVCVSI